MARNSYQKRLDNQLKTLYNIRSKVKKMKTAEHLLSFGDSFNKETSELTDETIRIIGAAIKESRDKSFQILRTPVIAGGAVRDAVYGLPPKDYDIFLDVSGVPEDEREDVVLLFGLRVLDNLQHDKRFRTLADLTLHPIGENGGYRDEVPNSFIGFETREHNPEAVEEYHNALRDLQGDYALYDVFLENLKQEMRFINLQFIGKTEPSLSRDDVLPFVETFDYGLVKGLYDPEKEAYELAPSFIETANTKTLESGDSKTLSRMRDFLRRADYVKKGYFTVVDKTPKVLKKTLKTSPFPFFSTGGRLAEWQEIPDLALQPGGVRRAPEMEDPGF